MCHGQRVSVESNAANGDGSRTPTISISATATAASTISRLLTSPRQDWIRAKTPRAPGSYEVTGNYFEVLGIQPYLGRVFHGSDEHGPNSAPYIVLTYAYWHSHFHNDHSVVG